MRRCFTYGSVRGRLETTLTTASNIAIVVKSTRSFHTYDPCRPNITSHLNYAGLGHRRSFRLYIFRNATALTFHWDVVSD